MYLLVLFLHSWLRWGAIIAGVLAVATLLGSQPRPGAPDPSDRWGRFFIIALDLQFVLGLLLYVGLSPTTAAIFHETGMAAAMKDPVARFWAVEHVTLDARRHRRRSRRPGAGTKGRDAGGQTHAPPDLFSGLSDRDSRRDTVAWDARRPAAVPGLSRLVEATAGRRSSFSVLRSTFLIFRSTRRGVPRHRLRTLRRHETRRTQNDAERRTENDTRPPRRLTQHCTTGRV